MLHSFDNPDDPTKVKIDSNYWLLCHVWNLPKKIKNSTIEKKNISLVQLTNAAISLYCLFDGGYLSIYSENKNLKELTV